nr:hypothetical protein [Acinetobacter baumannii]
MMDWASGCVPGGWNRANFTGLKFTKVKPWPQPGTVTGINPFALAAHWTTAGGDDALNQAVPFCYSPNVLFLRHDLRHTAVMNTLPDLSQLTMNNCWNSPGSWRCSISL